MKLTYKVLCIGFAASSLLFTQNYQELQKLQSEYKKALEKQSLQKPASISDAEKTALSTSIPDKLIYSRKDIESLLVNTEKLLLEMKFIKDSVKSMPFVGYDLFTKRDSIPFWQNLPIANDYKLGPGDEIIISLWGESNLFDSQIINRDGQIFIENIGILNLGGKSLSSAKKYILSKYSRVYSTLVGQNPKSFIDLTLGELKSINVHFVGFVNIPGVHMLHPFSNVITGLIQSGGVDNRGSLRDIKIIRNNEPLSSVDIYTYFINDGSFNDTRLLDQDIIYVSPRKSTIALTGRVLRPGYYEMLKSETLKDLLSYSGGKDRRSSENIFIFKSQAYNNAGYIVNSSDELNIEILQGDSIHVPQSPEVISYIRLDGQVKNPGKYPFNKKLKLSDVLNASESLSIDDYRKTMDLSNVKIFRKNPTGEKPLQITTSLDENITLKEGDHINIPPLKILQKIESIVITGEVQIPGIYPVNNLSTLEDVIRLSGGLTELALDGGIEIFRDSLRVGWNNLSLKLKAGDSLNVMRKSGLVIVNGEVNAPGYISYKKNYSVKDYINHAGGFTAFAEQKNIFVTYPNGISMSPSFWKKPKVKEGSVITVNQRTISGETQQSSIQIFSALTSQAGSIATTLLSLSLLMNQNNNAN